MLSEPYPTHPAQNSEPSTVGEALDRAIELARNRVQELCVLKAKAEATQMLHHPVNFIHQLAYNS